MKKCLLSFPFDSGTVQRHYEEGTGFELDGEILGASAVKDVVTNRQLTILWAVDMSSMRVHPFVKRLTGFSDVSGITSTTEKDVDHISTLTIKVLLNVELLAVLHLNGFAFDHIRTIRAVFSTL